MYVQNDFTFIARLHKNYVGGGWGRILLSLVYLYDFFFSIFIIILLIFIDQPMSVFRKYWLLKNGFFSIVSKINSLKCD